MSTTEAATSPAQQSPSRWQRFRSQLGLGIAWVLAPFVLGTAGAVLLFLLLDRVILGGRADLIDIGRSAAIGVTAALIFVGLRELWRRQRRREAEAADESGVRSSGDAAAKV